MPTRCQDCNSHFALDSSTIVNGISCPDCGSTRLERDVPSPVNSDGALRDMVDPATQLDQGGNPLQEGIWAGVDGGWQPNWRRDESYASVHYAVQRVEHPELACANCKRSGGVGLYPHESVVQCQRCGYVAPIGNEMGLRQRMDVADFQDHPYDYDTPGVPNDLGPVHQGRTSTWPEYQQQNRMGIPPDKQYDSSDEYWKQPQERGWMQQAPNDVQQSPGQMLTWAPGEPGRGLVSPSGEVHTWPEREGTHVHKFEALQVPISDWANWSQFFIRPDGTVSGLKPEHTQTVEQAVPGLQVRGGPVYEGWDSVFGAVIGYGNEEMCPQCGAPMHSHYEGRYPVHECDNCGYVLEPDWDSMPGGYDFENEHYGSVHEAMNLPPSGVEPQHHAEATPDTRGGIHNGNMFWLGFLDASINGKPVRSHGNEIFMEHGNPQHPSFGQPVTVSVHHPEHLPAAIEAVQTSALSPFKESLASAPILKETGGRIMRGEIPAPPGVPVPGAQPQPQQTMANINRPRASSTEPYVEDTLLYRLPQRTSIAPLLALGGRLLLSQALGGLMRKAVQGSGNFLDTNDQQPIAPGTRAPQLVASERTAVGIDAPVETPGSVPDMIEDHDPESVDQQEFNDQDHSPAFNNPNLDVDGNGADKGEDAMHQALEFSHDSPAVERAEMLLPLIMQFVNSDESALNDPQLRALHEQLEGEIPDYIKSADENSDAVQKLLESMRDPSGVHASIREGGGIWQETGTPGLTKMHPEVVNWKDQKVNQLMDQGMSYRQAIEQVGGELERGWATNENYPIPTTDMRTPGVYTHTGAGVYQNTPMNMNQMAMGPQQQQMPGPMPGTHANPISPGGMPVNGKCANCGGVTNADGSCPQCGAAAGANQMGNMAAPPGFEGQVPNAMHMGAGHQGPITPEQQAAVAQLLLEQGRENEIPIMLQQPEQYAEELAQIAGRDTQPPNVDPDEMAPPAPPQMEAPPGATMPMPGMSAPAPMQASRHAADNVAGRCPKCESATTGILSSEGDARCSRCGHIWKMQGVVNDDVTSAVKRSWKVRSLGETPNPMALPAADQKRPNDPEAQQDSTLTWQDVNGQPLTPGATYTMHNPNYPIPDIVQVQEVKPDGITVTMAGEYNSPTDPQDAPAPEYPDFISTQEMQQEGLTFQPQDQTPEPEAGVEQKQDGVGQTVNTEPVEQTHDFPMHASVEPDHCPNCNYRHITSSYVDRTTKQFECFRCAHAWRVADVDDDITMDEAARDWLNDSGDDFEVSERMLAMVQSGKSRSLTEIAQRDPRLQQIKERLDAHKEARTAGAKFSPREQKEFIDEDGVARNSDLLNLDGTHYVMSGKDNSKARPDRVDDNYLGLGL